MSPFSLFSSFRRCQAEPAAPEKSETAPLSSLEDRPEGGSDVTGWPFPAWTRYTFEAFLGRGAMGKVYRVFDPMLNRSVAIKVLGERTLHQSDRYLSEARAMARVDHPNVAKVFEVGEVEGQPYLAMQLLHGEPLHALRNKLGLEERVELMRQACEGVQAAHRMGLLHRDIKPSNIVVEEDADGRRNAFVVDFGLACDAGMTLGGAGTALDPPPETGTSLSETLSGGTPWGGLDAPTATSNPIRGGITGTPAFMSPEQAAGEPLDRRSDVFSLGSTLYAVLTGRAPFSGQSLQSLLRHVVLSRPEPLQCHDPHCPKDMEAILWKAMEKDPLKRYTSARALSLDLERWLKGEAVEAVQGRPFYRLTRWVQRNRAVAGLGALVGLALLAALGLGLRARWRARDQARHYQYFYQEAERMEARMTLAEAMPRHDTLSEREALQSQMRRLEGRMVEGGALAEAPGCYALGRGYLVLKKWDLARKSLERAWALGLQTPEAAYALGECLEEIYSEQLDGFYGQNRRERQAELDRTLKPAITAFLDHASRGSQKNMVLLAKGRLALAQENYPEARNRAEDVINGDPWNVNALFLKVKALFAEAAAGKSPAWPLYAQKIAQVLARAEDIARSSPAVYDMQANFHIEAMKEAITRRLPFEQELESALEAVAKARQAHSRNYGAEYYEAEAWCAAIEQLDDPYWKKAEHAKELPGCLRRAINCADRSLALGGPPQKALNVKGALWWMQSVLDGRQGRDVRPGLDKAIATFQEALAASYYPMSEPLANLGSCYAMRGDEEIRRGQDGSSFFSKAKDCYAKAIQLRDQPVYHWNLIELHNHCGRFLAWQGRDPRPEYRAALASATKAKAAMGRQAEEKVAEAYLNLAQWAAWHNQTDEESLRLGCEKAEAARRFDPKSAVVWQAVAKAHLLRSFLGRTDADLAMVRRLLSGRREGDDTAEVGKLKAWLMLEQFRLKPSWRAFLALEKQVIRAQKGANPDPELHLYPFDACRAALRKNVPGDRWRERMHWHLQQAKVVNPLMGPWVDTLGKDVVDHGQ